MRRQHNKHRHHIMINKFTSLLFILISLFSFQNTNAQILNGGFETWLKDVDDNFNPQYWETTNDGTDTSVFRYSPGYAGNYSMLVKTFDPGFMAIPGIANVSFPFNLRPTSIKACIKTKVTTGDMCFVILGLMKGDSEIAAIDSCTFKFDSTMSQFRCFSLPIKYISNKNPDTAVIMVIAGGFTTPKLGTQIIIDELSFGFGNGINEFYIPSNTFRGIAYPNPTTNQLSIPIELQHNTDIQVSISSIDGRLIKTIPINNVNAGNQVLTIPVDELPAGAYLYTLKIADSEFSARFNVIH